jgi:hypothetical protein
VLGETGEHPPLLHARVDRVRDKVEPSLFFRQAAPGRLADALVRRMA